MSIGWVGILQGQKGTRVKVHGLGHVHVQPWTCLWRVQGRKGARFLLFTLTNLCLTSHLVKLSLPDIWYFQNRLRGTRYSGKRKEIRRKFFHFDIVCRWLVLLETKFQCKSSIGAFHKTPISTVDLLIRSPERGGVVSTPRVCKGQFTPTSVPSHRSQRQRRIKISHEGTPKHKEGVSIQFLKETRPELKSGGIGESVQHCTKDLILTRQPLINITRQYPPSHPPQALPCKTKPRRGRTGGGHIVRVHPIPRARRGQYGEVTSCERKSPQFQRMTRISFSNQRIKRRLGTKLL